MENTLKRHKKIALQFSGGKDSLVCLYLLKPFWDLITVYWLNTGDAFPETKSLMDKIKAMVPNFVEVESDVRNVRSENGIPSDIVPVSATSFGAMSGDCAPVLIQSRYSCCFATLMKPMHERMIADGITLIIRGQRSNDRHKSTLRSGDFDGGIELFFPIEDWTEKQVIKYLRDQHVDVPRFYEVMDSMPDCMGCTAWWGERRVTYLRRYHFGAYKEYQANLDLIRQAVGAHIEEFNKEVTL